MVYFIKCFTKIYRLLHKLTVLPPVKKRSDGQYKLHDCNPSLFKNQIVYYQWREIHQIFLSLTIEALQGKMCQNSLPSGVGRSLGAKISGGRGRSWGIFFGFDKTRHILLSNGANCTVLRAVVMTQYRRVTDGRTDGRTDRRNCCS